MSVNCDQRVKWSPEKIATLKQLRASGQTAAEIGKAFGISRSAILAKLDKLGIPCPPRISHGQRYIPGFRSHSSSSSTSDSVLLKETYRGRKIEAFGYVDLEA